MLVGDRLGELPAESVRLAATVRDALRPGPGEAQGPGLALEIGHEARLAHPGLAGHEDDARRVPSAVPA